MRSTVSIGEDHCKSRLAREKKKVCSLSPSCDRLREIFGETDIFKVKIADMRKRITGRDFRQTKRSRMVDRK